MNDPMPVSALLRDMAAEALTRAVTAAHRAGDPALHAEIVETAARTTARLHCVHCQGDIDHPDWYYTIGEGRCTCLARCPGTARAWCLAAGLPGGGR